MRQVTAVHFAGSAVSTGAGGKWVTVQDCRALQPASERGGYRRHTYFTLGQMTLFQRCRSEHGRHDLAAGYLAAGPNAFVECQASAAHGFSGPIELSATGLPEGVRLEPARVAEGQTRVRLAVVAKDDARPHSLGARRHGSIPLVRVRPVEYDWQLL